MKLVIEKLHGVIYAYRESETHHKDVLRTQTLFLEGLDRECNLSVRDDFVLIVDIKEKKKK